MKTFVYVVAGTAIVVVLALAGLVIWLMNESVKGANKMRTEAARKARWEPKEPRVTVNENGVLEEIKNTENEKI